MILIGLKWILFYTQIFKRISHKQNVLFYRPLSFLEPTIKLFALLQVVTSKYDSWKFGLFEAYEAIFHFSLPNISSLGLQDNGAATFS